MFSPQLEDYLNKISRSCFNAAQSKDSALALAVLLQIEKTIQFYIKHLEEGKNV